MTVFLFAVLGLVVLAGALLFIRYKYYRSWDKFLDDLAEQVALDWMPGPMKVIVILGLVVWGASAAITYFTQELRVKDPNAKPLADSPALTQLASAADLPSAAAGAAGGAGDQAGGSGNQPGGNSAAPDQAALPPPNIPEAPPAVNPDQLQELLKEIQAQPNPAQMNAQAKLPELPQPPALTPMPMEKNSTFETSARAAEKRRADANLPPNDPLIILQRMREAQTEQVGSGQSLFSPGSDAHIQTISLERPSHTAVKSEEEPDTRMTAADGRNLLDLVILANGQIFEGRVLQQNNGYTWFHRPTGDILKIPDSRVAKVIDYPRQWPIAWPEK